MTRFEGAVSSSASSSTRAIEIVVPMAPPSDLMPNKQRRQHWTIRAEATAQLRMAAKGAAMNARHALGQHRGVLFLRPVIVAYEVIWPWLIYGDSQAIPDCDAIPAAAKAVLDGIVDAAVIASDGEGYVELVMATGRRGTKDEDGMTVVTISEVEVL